MHRWLVVALIAASSHLLASCASTSSADSGFEGMAGRYVEKYLEMNPEQATVLGDHRFDHRLNDYSADGVKQMIEFNRSALADLKKIDPQRLSAVNRVDYHILLSQINGTIYALETLREHEWNPLLYNVGGAIYYLVAREFAPLPDRMESVIARLTVVPEVAALAKANLKNPPRVHVETAIQQNQGTISLIRDELDEFIKETPELEPEFRKAQRLAVDALVYYGNWLERDLLPEANGDFRLGREKFTQKLRYTLDSEFTAEQILERAEADLASTHDALFETALPLYNAFAPHPVDAKTADRKQVITAVLDKLAESHPTNETIVDEAQKCLESCTQFTIEHELVSVPEEPIRLIVMPEFQRGVAVAYCDPPGPLESGGQTFFAISPTPESWSSERVTSFFREYNNYMLQDLTIHEAMPGHFVQLAHGNRFEAPTNIRAIFYSGPFVEGWATYAEQFMAENGYGGPEVRMQELKMRLRLIINAIIDQKIHCDGMTETEALTLMRDEGFQEEGESAGKWRRACLTSTQLSTYYVGNLEMNEIRRLYRAKYGDARTTREMHDQMLSFGSPPPKYVRELMGL